MNTIGTINRLEGKEGSENCAEENKDKLSTGANRLP